ncbi:MAG: TIGR01244 family phosphatase [Acetobacter sp.]|nr:TIGR01244 family phosphatase [Acetobacter sp.]
MRCHHLTPEFAISPQISLQDIQTIREAGFRTIICNRPNGEEANQPDSATIAKIAKESGLFFVDLPIEAGSTPSSDTIKKMQEALNTLPGPVLAYCRTGNRAAQAWNMAIQNNS